jgi:hypothetical protein
MLKQFKNRHDLSKGDDPRASNTLIENKTKKLMDKTRNRGHGP